MKILILPGLNGTADLMPAFLAQLPDEHDATVFQYPVDKIGYDDLLAWVRPQLPTEDYVIVAESFSGPLAVRIAEARLPNLKGIVFVATFAKTPRRVPSVLTYAVQFLPVTSRLFVRLGQPLVTGRWAAPALTQALQRALTKVPQRTLAGRLREVLRVDVADALAAVDVPFVYLRAKHDRLIPVKATAPFAAADCPIVDIDGPHFLLQANPSPCAHQLAAFIKSLGQRKTRQSET